MIESLSIERFLALRHKLPVVDVRSPLEFECGHVPGTVNVALFSNEERAMIGTAYKKESQEAAIDLGLEFAETRRPAYLNAVRSLDVDRGVIVHCWRGGMRSARFAEFLEANGIAVVHVLQGGYKNYRGEVHRNFALPRKMTIIGGYTGTGKTELLHFLKRKSEQVIDLEGLAEHRGSAFGLLPGKSQPTTEQFENYLFEELIDTDTASPLFLEDENASIGRVYIPHPFYVRMQESEMVFFDVPQAVRAARLAEDYGKLPMEYLWERILRIKKKLGGQRLKLAEQYLNKGQMDKTAALCLSYYDKMYLRALRKKSADRVTVVPCGSTNPLELYAGLKDQLTDNKNA